MPARIKVTSDPSSMSSVDARLVIGRASRLLEADVAELLSDLPPATWQAMVKRTDPGDGGRVATTWTGGSPARISAGVLPEACSRHNSPSRAWAIPSIVQSAAQKGHVGIVLATDAAEHVAAAALAVARALPTFTAVSSPVDREVRILPLPGKGEAAPAVSRLQIAVDAARLAAHLTDQPPDHFGCDAFVAKAEEVAAGVGAEALVYRREGLREHGLRGIDSVGRAAEEEPALIVLDHRPSGGGADEPPVVWVGKGIVYDTGGLSLKTKTGMPGMKTDMAGAAAVLAAFSAAVRLGYDRPLTAVLCVAENAVGPHAIRPDDIIAMYSGRSVEVNNTDAEGRLVLADGVAWAARHRRPGTVIDLATLTGAQAMATGKRTAALYCNDDELEARATAAGRASGDLVHPLPYQPELLRREFSSTVADMRNSVKDRHNAQSGCAAQFIGNHLHAAGYDKLWLHVDMAGPSVSGHRGTGFGVGLLLSLHDLL